MKVSQTKEQCVHDICRFPLIYNKSRSLTPIQILDRSGYSVFCEQISKQDIIDELKKDNGLITCWLNFTEDKRWSPAWGISRNNNEYILFYCAYREVEIKQAFEDPYEPCAIMIRMEMESLMKR